MKILVTGASGLIGRSLTDYLLRKFPTAEIVGTYFSNPPKVTLNSGQSGLEKLSYISYTSAIKETTRYDQIWHFATYGQPAKFISDWKPVVKLNTEDIISLCSNLSPDGKFYYASTSEIYGSKEESSEDIIPSSYTCTPRSIYVDSKRLGESILYSLLPAKSYRIFRICLAYSPYFDIGDRRVLYELVVKGIQKKEIKLLDDGSALRQYLYIDDACEMMFRLAVNNFSDLHLGDSPPIFNISNNYPISIFELAQAIATILKVPVITGPSTRNVHSALSKVSVLPKRFSNLYPEFQFTSLEKGLTLVCSEAQNKLKN